MVDYSFIRFKNNFTDAKNIGNSPVTQIPYFDSISLSPKESYLQLTNIEGGISLEGDYEVYIVDCNDNGLKDVTDNFFITEITSENGTNQLEIEIVNINSDFYRETVYFRIKSLLSNDVYYSNPLNITDYQKETTTYFEYKNFEDFEGIPYTSSQKWQSIRLKSYFDVLENQTEVSDYFQISRNRTISTRPLIKRFERFNAEEIDMFTYDRLNTLLVHDLIYIDGVRVSNKTTLEDIERIELSSLVNSSFTISKDYNDKKEYKHQIFSGFQPIEFIPFSNTTLAGLSNSINLKFNLPINILEGFINLYNKDTNALINSFTETDMYLDGTNVIAIDDLDTFITENGSYYFTVSSGLVEDVTFGLCNDAIIDNSTWCFTVNDGDFDRNDFDSNDFYTN